MMRALFALPLFFAVTATGCSGCGRDDRKETAREQLPPLAAPSPTVPLAVPGFSDAVVVVPVGITRPAPVVVAVIGIGDTPEEQCGTWKELVGQRAFVLCPRGKPHFVRVEPSAETGPTEADVEGAPRAAAGGGAETSGDDGETAPPVPSDAPPKQMGFFVADAPSLERELDAGLAALRTQWGKYVADQEVVYAGFSRGAFLGAQIAANRPQRFKRVVLVEGGHSPWTEERAAAFARGGGKRVLFACGQPSCVDDAQAAASLLTKQKVETRVVHGVGEGHGYKRQVKDEVSRSFEWLVEEEPLWRQLLAK